MTLFSSEKFRLNASDFVRGAILAVLTAVLTFIYELWQSSGSWPTGDEWAGVLKIAFGAFVAYLIKNVLSGPAVPPDGTPTASEVKKAA